MSRNWRCAGTYQYMSPEVIRHEMYDSRADVYSWGVLFAECLHQQPPYEGLYCTPTQVLCPPASQHSPGSFYLLQPTVSASHRFDQK